MLHLEIVSQSAFQNLSPCHATYMEQSNYEVNQLIPLFKSSPEPVLGPSFHIPPGCCHLLSEGQNATTQLLQFHPEIS